MIHAEAFEALLVARNLLKSAVAKEAGFSPSFLSTLLCHRAGASPAKAEALADALGVPIAAIFPEASGWVSPLPDRGAKRVAA